MMTENMTLQELYVISLSLTPNEKWRAAGSFSTASSSEGLFTALAVIALITAVILLFWVFARYRRSEHNFNLAITELTVNQIKLKQQIYELTTANEKLQQENTVLSQKKIEALENKINAEIPVK
jgi:Tfp pilus assembly protein PilN